MARTNEGNGKIFQNKRKNSDRHPDLKGDFTIPSTMIEAIKNAPRNADGSIKVFFAGWWREGPTAGKYISAILTAPVKGESAPRATRQSGKYSDDKPKDLEDFEDEIPF